MRRVALIGSTQLSGRLLYYFEATGFAEVEGLFDDFQPVGSVRHGRPVLGPIAEVPRLFRAGAFDEVAVAVGYKHRRFRKETFEFLTEAGIPVASFAHPTSFIEPSAVLGRGCIVLVDCTVDMNARLGDNVFVSSRCFISHDTTIGSHTFCGAAINIAGYTTVGECCFLGVGTTTIDGVTIGLNVQTAGGAVVTRDVQNHVMVAGVPAAVKKELHF